MRIPVMLYRGVLLTALLDDLTDRDAAGLQSDLMRLLQSGEGRGVLIDVSAIERMDSYLIQVIQQTADMAALLGGQVVVCGMKPSVAVVMSEMTGGRVRFRTMLNLGEGMDYLVSRIAAAGSAARPPERANGERANGKRHSGERS
ncbi:MAG: STAS domain-containing protein [Rhodospirillaceae bacterium]